MSRAWLAPLLVLGGFLAAFQSPAQQEEPMSARAASELFLERCVACHVAPDLAYATDRAWVEQVRETA
ncbi:MAG TPA: hypothetical protein VK843_11345 [Planctomycetota bacterium]|nr:hypothetical protein [Planctomycetota bacterium]